MPGSIKFFKKKVAPSASYSYLFKGAGDWALPKKLADASVLYYLELKIVKLTSGNIQILSYDGYYARWRYSGAVFNTGQYVTGNDSTGFGFSTGDTVMLCVRRDSNNQGSIFGGKNGTWYPGATLGRLTYSSSPNSWAQPATLRIMLENATDEVQVMCNPADWKYGALKLSGSVGYPY